MNLQRLVSGMIGLKTICFLILFCGILLRLLANGSVIAEIDGVPLHIDTLCMEAKRMLPDAAVAPDVREVKLRSAVLTELKIRETLDILKQNNIACGQETAEWYIVERTKNSRSSNKGFAEELQKLVNDRRFQLKCAIYRYLAAVSPEKLYVAPEEVESFYFHNQLKYRISTPGVYKVIMAPAGKESHRSAADIRFALLQGENPEQAAMRFRAKCILSTPETALRFKHLNLRKNAVSDVISLNGQPPCVVVCLEEPKSGFIPFKQLESLIEEELISRRAGALFDEILKKRVSRKNIKYRR